MNAKSAAMNGFVVKMIAADASSGASSDGQSASQSAKVWNGRKPLRLGHPARWSLETVPEGLKLRTLGETGEPTKETARLIKHAELLKNPSITLVPGVGKTTTDALTLELRAIEMMPSVSLENESDTGAMALALRIFHQRGEWSVDSYELLKKFVARFENQKVFAIHGTPSGLYDETDAIRIEILVDGVMIGNRELKRGETINYGRESAAGLCLVYRGADWKIASFKPSAPLPMGVQKADDEGKLFNRVLMAAALLLLLCFSISFLIPTPEVAKTEEKVQILLAPKKPKVMHATAAPKGEKDSHQFSVGKTGSAKNAGRKGGGPQKAAQYADSAVKAEKATKGESSSKAKHEKKVAKAAAAPKAPKKIAKAAPAPKHHKTKVAKADPGPKRAAPPSPSRAAEPRTPSPVAKAAVRVTAPSNPSKRPSRVASTGAKPLPVPQSELFKAFSSSAFKEASKSLVSGGVSGVAAGGGGGGSAAEARSFGSAGGSGKGGLGSAGGVSTGSTSVGTLGGGSNAGDGGPGSSGPGYGRGSNSKVSGRGRSLVAVDTGASEVSDGLSMDEVGKVIAAHWAEVRYCYEASALRNDGSEGNVKINFSIGAPGAVRSAGVSSATNPDRRLHECLVSRLKGWKFPKPHGGQAVAVVYPFNFKKIQ